MNIVKWSPPSGRGTRPWLPLHEHLGGAQELEVPAPVPAQAQASQQGDLSAEKRQAARAEREAKIGAALKPSWQVETATSAGEGVGGGARDMASVDLT